MIHWLHDELFPGIELGGCFVFFVYCLGDAEKDESETRSQGHSPWQKHAGELSADDWMLHLKFENNRNFEEI